MSPAIAVSLVRTSRHPASAPDPSPRTDRPEDRRVQRPAGDDHRRRFSVEFGSVVDALRCATEWQQGMAERNAGVGENCIDFRVGVHQGDIVVEGDDIFGDGVNVAARLEGLADPGGIWSQPASGRRCRQLNLAFEDLGERRLKNIARLVRVYAAKPVAAPGSSKTTATQPPGAPQLSSSSSVREPVQRPRSRRISQTELPTI